MKNYETKIWNDYEKCILCPRNCGAARNDGTKNSRGVCGVSSQLKVARAALHFWEEPCISGTNGSGAVFFSGCSLHCVFCQNQEISTGQQGKEMEPERLVEIFLHLQEQGAHNINLVTAGHYLPQVIWAVEHARNQGMQLPVVYNTGSYEKAENIKKLEGIVDVYLPDFKFMSPEVSGLYAKAKDYAGWAKQVIQEMVRQQPVSRFIQNGQDPKNPENVHEEYEDKDLIVQGVIVRQLLLPGQLYDAKQILKYLFEEYGNRIYYSLMSQYTPLAHVEKYPELQQRVSEEAYANYVQFAINLGIEHGFTQEREVAVESFIPKFDGEGV